MQNYLHFSCAYYILYGIASNIQYIWRKFILPIVLQAPQSFKFMVKIEIILVYQYYPVCDYFIDTFHNQDHNGVTILLSIKRYKEY